MMKCRVPKSLPKVACLAYLALACPAIIYGSEVDQDFASAWDRGHQPDGLTILHMAFEGDLYEGSMGKELKLGNVPDSEEASIPEFKEGPPHLGQAVQIGPDAVLNTGRLPVDDAVTVSFWLKLDEPGIILNVFNLHSNPVTGDRHRMVSHLSFEPSGDLVLVAQFGDHRNTVRLRGNTSVDDGHWHHVAIVYEAKPEENTVVVSLFVDGEELGSPEPAIGPLPSQLSVRAGSFVFTSNKEKHRGARFLLDELLVQGEVLKHPNRPVPQN